jgi:protein-disulfide isomerase
VLQQLAPQYVDTGKVRLIYRNFPVIGPESEQAAQAVECAGDQNKYWMFAAYLFANQGAENSGVFKAANLKAMAEKAGLDTGAFNSCLDGNKYRSRVQDELATGRQKGVTGTPTFFINGEKREGVLTQDQFVAAIEAATPK